MGTKYRLVSAEKGRALGTLASMPALQESSLRSFWTGFLLNINMAPRLSSGTKNGLSPRLTGGSAGSKAKVMPDLPALDYLPLGIP